ncbi:MAG: tRNA (N(6)-L-threonylcarbamoyladenosine(37)-C(2))-methylthiotransferase MtaB [Candidatus Omnitrophica bacterium]|nr:tRNA (N(6)-L-threonylcarbamoyladenosine(37)-C(2))-methylthiotransferase MtaB [Candidatus Omnitrophota bacterium]
MSSFYIKTLGCKVNRYEEQVIRENLLSAGMRESDSAPAIIVVNSCTVTGKADAKTRGAVRGLKKRHPDARIIVTGCHAVLKEDIERLRSIEEVDLVVPNSEKYHLHRKAAEMAGLHTCPEKTVNGITGFGRNSRAFLKIQDGCDQGCAYCKVHMVRGPSRSRSRSDIREEFDRLVGSGYKEIVFTGICLGGWRGKGDMPFAELLRLLGKVSGEYRIRLSSIEPNFIDGKLVDAIRATDKVCGHFHIPLQSGSDNVLRRMGRRYDTSGFRGLVRMIRTVMPRAGISLDIISGFPGEDEDDFLRTYEFIRELEPSRLHVFSYSDRRGTKAYDMPEKVPANVIKERVSSLIRLGGELQGAYCERFAGREVEVLAERRTTDGAMEGYSGEYVRSKIFCPDLSSGELVRGTVTEIDRENNCLVIKTSAAKG